MCQGKTGDMEICCLLTEGQNAFAKVNGFNVNGVMEYCIYEIFVISSVIFDLHLPKELEKVKDHRINKIAPDTFSFQGCE